MFKGGQKLVMDVNEGLRTSFKKQKIPKKILGLLFAQLH